MKLKEYLIEEGRSQRWLSRKTGINEATISRMVKGKCIPRGSLIKMIEIVTEKKVTSKDFEPDLEGNSEKKT